MTKRKASESTTGLTAGGTRDSGGMENSTERACISIKMEPFK